MIAGHLAEDARDAVHRAIAGMAVRALLSSEVQCEDVHALTINVADDGACDVVLLGADLRPLGGYSL